MSRGPGLTASLKHRDFRWLMAAFTTSATGSWLYNVALLVWVFEATDSVAWLSATTVCRFVPALVFSAYAGVLADRFEKVMLMVRVDVAWTLVTVVMAVEMMLGAPVWGVLAAAAVISTLSTVYEPASAALTPHLVPESELASANALRNLIDNVTVVAGPGLGAVLVLLGPPEVAVWVNAATFAASAFMVSRVRLRTEAADVTEGGEAGPLAQMLVGGRTILDDPAVAVLVAYSVLATFAFGVDTVLFVAISDGIVGTGATGYGYLLAGLGIGGILAAPLVTRVESRASLGPIILAGMAFYTLPTLLLLVNDSPALAFAVQVVRGAGTLVVDVLAITALQRTLSHDVLARVFGAFDGLCLAVILLGSAVTPVVLNLLGLEAAIWASSAGIFAVSLLGLPWLARVDRASRERRAALEPRIVLLEQCDLFERVPDGGLVQLASAAEEVRVPAGEVVVRQGAEADAFYVVVEGTAGVASVAVDGTSPAIPDLGPGDYFGEIGLIERIARTATVTARTDLVVLRIDGAVFLDSLTVNQPSAAMLDGAALRLGRTHPSLTVRRSGLFAPTGDQT